MPTHRLARTATGHHALSGKPRGRGLGRGLHSLALPQRVRETKSAVIFLDRLLAFSTVTLLCQLLWASQLSHCWNFLKPRPRGQRHPESDGGGGSDGSGSSVPDRGLRGTQSEPEHSMEGKAPDTQSDACYRTEVSGAMQTRAGSPALEPFLPPPTLGSRLWVQNRPEGTEVGGGGWHWFRTQPAAPGELLPALTMDPTGPGWALTPGSFPDRSSDAPAAPTSPGRGPAVTGLPGAPPQTDYLTHHRDSSSSARRNFLRAGRQALGAVGTRSH